MLASQLPARELRLLCSSLNFNPTPGLADKMEGVVFLNYVSDAKLRWLYDNAQAFVLPSLLEGFGIPVAEAFGRGLIPIVSKDSALEEVAGAGAVLINPNDISKLPRHLHLSSTCPLRKRRCDCRS